MRRALLCGIALVVVAGCGRAPDAGGTAEPNAFEKRAAQVAQAWQAAGIGDAWTKGFVPVQALTIEPRDGFPDSELKNAFGAGWYTTALQLPDQAGNGVVRFPDGGTLEVPLVSARAAYQAIDLGDASGCTGCVNLEVTAAELGEATLRTSRGEAKVPAWLFTIKDLAKPVARIAVSPSVIKEIPETSVPEWDREGALVSAQSLTAVRDSTIEYKLGVGACDKDITGYVWESPFGDVVVIGGTVTPPGPAEICTAQLVEHPVQVTVASPVGDRVILDAITGSPVLQW